MRIFWDLFENGTIVKQYYERRCNERTTCIAFLAHCVLDQSMKTRVTLQPTDLRKNKMYVRVYLICMNFIVQLLIPFTVLILLNYLTYRTIKVSEKNLLQNFR